MVVDSFGIETFWITHFLPHEQGYIGEVTNKPRVAQGAFLGAA